MPKGPSGQKRSPETNPPYVRVVFKDNQIVIGGRVLQLDEDPLDLMERYFDEGEPDPKKS